MTIDELRTLIKDYDDCQEAIKQLEDKLKRLKERENNSFYFSAYISDNEDGDIYFHHLEKVYSKQAFEEFIQNTINKIYNRAIEIAKKVNRLQEVSDNEPSQPEQK